MKKVKIIIIILVLFLTSNLLGKNYDGHNLHPNRLLKKYNCTVYNENEDLGALVINCQNSSIGGPVEFFYSVTKDGCRRALKGF